MAIKHALEILASGTRYYTEPTFQARKRENILVFFVRNIYLICLGVLPPTYRIFLGPANGSRYQSKLYSIVVLTSQECGISS